MSEEERLLFTKTSHSVMVSVYSEFMEDQSDMDSDIYVWAYHIHIKNLRKSPVQLIRRHWKVVSAEGHVQEVTGDGVVGVQPELEPDGEFQYASSAKLGTPSGMMVGWYEFLLIDAPENPLRVEVPTFPLDCPLVRQTAN